LIEHRSVDPHSDDAALPKKNVHGDWEPTGRVAPADQVSFLEHGVTGAEQPGDHAFAALAIRFVHTVLA